MKNTFFFCLMAAFFIGLSSCGNNSQNAAALPIYGFADVINGDTIHPSVPPFQFMNQDSQWVTKKTFEDKIYIADVFFTFCPTICPKVKKNSLKIYNKYLEDDRVLLLSHTVAPKYDTVPALKKYADKLEISSSKWHLVTGDKDSIYHIANKYFLVAKEDDTAPGGFDHSGNIVLVDKNGQVRANADGTDARAVDDFMLKIDQLLEQEMSNSTKSN